MTTTSEPRTDAGTDDKNGHVPQPAMRNTIAYRASKRPKRGELEHRTLPLDELRVQDAQEAVADGDGGRKLIEFDGYASLFGRSYKVGPYEETIEPGAFKRSLSNPSLDVVLRTEHSDLPLARTTGAITLTDGRTVPTLSLSEDNTGLHVRALLDPSDPDVQRLVPKYKRGDLKEMSFAFRANDDAWSDDYTQRTIRSAEIHRGDVSIVTYGASSSTSSTMRSEQAVLELREVGGEGLIGSLQDFAFQWVANYYSLHGMRATLDELEGRAGKVLSSTSLDVLRNVLQLISDADDAVDQAQPMLADLMGVPNPDDDDDDGNSPSGDADDLTSSEQLDWLKERAPEEELRAMASETPGDATRSAPHLLDSTLHDLAHAQQHLGRLSDSDVLKNDQSLQFNIEHVGNHLDSAQDHARRLGQHLEQHASDPETFTAERQQLNAQRAEAAEKESTQRTEGYWEAIERLAQTVQGWSFERGENGSVTLKRDQPTGADWSVAQDLKQIKLCIAAAKADQLTDPDNATDPDDKAVNAALDAADAAIDAAIVAQAKDGAFEDDMNAEYWETEEYRKTFSAADREKAAKSGAAMPDGSFPINNTSDLKNAIQAFGRAKDPAAAKAHIIKRAKALGATNLLPEDWRSAELLPSSRYDEFELELRGLGR